MRAATLHGNRIDRYALERPADWLDPHLCHQLGLGLQQIVDRTIQKTEGMASRIAAAGANRAPQGGALHLRAHIVQIVAGDAGKAGIEAAL